MKTASGRPSREEAMFRQWKLLYDHLDANRARYHAAVPRTGAPEEVLMDAGAEAWETAARLPEFEAMRGRAINGQTEVAVLWNGDTLFLRLTCHDSIPDERKARFTRHDDIMAAPLTGRCMAFHRLMQPTGKTVEPAVLRSFPLSFTGRLIAGACISFSSMATPGWCNRTTVIGGRERAILTAPRSMAGFSTTTNSSGPCSRGHGNSNLLTSASSVCYDSPHISPKVAGEPVG